MPTAALDNYASITTEWPTDQTVYLTLDFECDYGTALPTNSYKALEATDQLVALLEEKKVPLTCFVQTAVLDKHPEAVETLRASSIPVSFHPHSHTHKPRNQTSIEYEVAESTSRYREFFGTDPVGYRLPNGNIRAADYEHLVAYDYDFDASVFPSWRPGHFNNTDAATNPTYFPDFDLIELPFTVYSDTVRIPTALSYCQVLGFPYSQLLTFSPPSSAVLNIHMHDLTTPESYKNLPRFYKMIYARNENGFPMLQNLLSRFQAQDYQFAQLDDAHKSIRNEVAND
ncbi:polysaccharide deacetylase family protein [Natribaculum luteum]|uniref:Polysaccharide deacetylase family protein n=1 Tax=Natribaculum luteum TaxID=1586232 RepID=A0ABD5NY32_9EURY|nr:polysaccharide deacetylase family protein [Natribaculum luteum]